MTKPLIARRFILTERCVHWSNAVGFMALLISGFLLLFRRPLDLAEPTIHILVNMHLAAAFLFAGGPAFAWLIGDTAAGLQWARDALHWRRKDFVWLALIGPHLIFHRIELPDQGRFNAGQRVNLWGQFLFKVTFCVTGLAMIFMQGQLGMLYIHLGCMVVSVCFLLGHLFMSVLNPDTRHSLRGIFTGWVRADWAHRHHPNWLRQKDTVVREDKKYVEKWSVMAKDDEDDD